MTDHERQVARAWAQEHFDDPFCTLRCALTYAREAYRARQRGEVA